MPASLVTFANFGRKKNLRTTDAVPIAEAFIQAGELKQIICQINTGYSFPNTYSAIPSIIRYPLRAFEKITKRPFSRERMDKIFDFFAARRLKPADVVFIHGGFFLPKTVKRAKALGAITVDISVSAHIAANVVLEAEEFSLLGISNYTGTYTTVSRDMTPLEQIDYMILMSDFAKKTYLDAGYPEDKIYIAYLDVDTVRFTPGTPRPKDAPFRVLYTAYTTPLKGLHYLIEAWNSLKLANAELVLVGGYGAMPQELKDRYGALIAENPSITWIESSLAPETYYREADVFVFPSLTEGFGRSTIEAMACGLPVITSEHAPGMVEDGKTGFVVPVRSPQAIAEKIKYLYDHRDITEEMGKAARTAVENKKPFGQAVLEIYKEILEKENKK